MDNTCAMNIEHRQPVEILSELLVLQAQGGDREALAELVDLWSPKLNARAYWLTRDSEGALEVAQEAWIGIARGLCSLKDPSRFGAWSMRIVHHKAADWIKARTKDRAMQSRLQESTPPHSQDRATDDDQVIRDAIGHLEPKLRDVVYLFYMDNCPLEQVAGVLNIPMGTAKTRLKRARTKLKPILKQLLERNTK